MSLVQEESKVHVRLRPDVPLKDHSSTSGGQGRKYCPVHAAVKKGGKTPHGTFDEKEVKSHRIRLEDMILSAQLSALAYISDDAGSVKATTPCCQKAIIGIVGGKQFLNSNLSSSEKQQYTEIENKVKDMSLTTILKEHMGGIIADKIFSINHTLLNLQRVDTQGYIAHKDNQIIIAYRGTTNIADWKTNFSPFRTVFEPEKDGKNGHSGFFGCCSPPGTDHDGKLQVHAGFYNAFLPTVELINQYIMPKLEKGDGVPAKSVIVTGHSLGGALATLAFAYLLMRFKDKHTHPHQIFLITEGAPRVGDKEFRDWMHGEVKRLGPNSCGITRICNDRDVVPTVPLQLQGYEHLDKLCFIADKDLYINPSVEDMTKASQGEEWCKRGWCTGPERIDDHMIDGYLQMLTEYAENVKDIVDDDGDALNKTISEVATNKKDDDKGLQGMNVATPSTKEEEPAAKEDGYTQLQQEAEPPAKNESDKVSKSKCGCVVQ
jgi:hypothetical protein